MTCTGNHDYDWVDTYKINNRTSSQLSTYASFPLTTANVIAYYEPGKLENIVVNHTIQGLPIAILSLEFGPRTEVVEWANEYVASHPELKFILMTHEFLTSSGLRVSSGSYAEQQFVNTTWNSPEQIWQTLVKENDNIVGVLCGHSGFATHLFTENTAGRQVPQILFNLQYQNNGGDGWVELWEFPEGDDNISVSVYNTITRSFHPDPATSFQFKY